MARKRMIDPSFWTDEQLGTCPIEARLLFMGLISQADDDGRLSGHPALIKSQIFPYDFTMDSSKVDEWIEMLQEKRLITKYNINNQKYILVRNFKKHQTINKPVKSKLPEPPDDNYRSPTVVLPHNEQRTTAQENLKEEKLKEEEVKGSEGNAHSTFNDPIKDRIFQFATKCEIKNLNIIVAEADLFFFIGKLDEDVIEEALKKTFGKKFGYAQTILTEWWNEGKTTMEKLRPRQPQRGFPNSQQSGKPRMKVVSDNATPQREVTPEERERMRELARKMKDESA